MSKEGGWIWTERIFNRIPLPYQVVSAILGLIIYVGYEFFGITINRFPLPFKANLPAIAMCIVIAYEIAGIQYLLNVMKRILSYSSSLYGISLDSISMIAEKRFRGPYWYYILVFSVVAPFYLMDWIYPSDPNLLENFKILYLPIHKMFPTNWGVLFDIYTQLLGILELFFIAVILWIMANITWTLRSPAISASTYPLKINIFKIKMRIHSIRNSILKVLTYYFICISLAITSYVSPTKFYIKETFFLIILLLIGILFFFLGLDAIQRVLKDRVEYELDEIDKKSQEQIQRLTKIASDDDYDRKSNELSCCSNLLDAFQKQRERCEQINTNLFDISSIGRFISVFLFPFVASTIKINPDYVSHILNNFHNMTSYVLPK